MKNLVILELEKYNELINKINRLEKERRENICRLNFWSKKVDEIDEQFRGLFETIIREDIIGTDEVIISDINDRDIIAKYVNDNLKLEFLDLKEERKCK